MRETGAHGVAPWGSMAAMRPRLVRASPLHRLGAALGATALAVSVGISPAAVRTAFAAGPLRVEADTRYELDPEAGRVHVAIDFKVTNLKPNTAPRSSTTTAYLFAIQPEAVRSAPPTRSAPSRSRSGNGSSSRASRSSLPELPVLRPDDAVHRPLRPGRRRAPIRLPGSREPGVRHVRRLGVGRQRPGHGRGQDPATASSSTVDGDPHETSTLLAPARRSTAEPAKPDELLRDRQRREPRGVHATRISLAGDIEIVVRAWPEDERMGGDGQRDAADGHARAPVELIGLDWPVDHDLRGPRAVHAGARGLRRRVLHGRGTDRGQRGSRSGHDHPRGLARLVQRRPVRRPLDLRGPRRGVRVAGPDRPRRARRRPARDGPTRTTPGSVPLDAGRSRRSIRDEETDDRERYGYEASFWLVHRIVEAAGVDADARGIRERRGEPHRVPGRGPARDGPPRSTTGGASST